MGYGCEKEFHVEDFIATVRKTSPVQRTIDGRAIPAGNVSVPLDPLTNEQRLLLLNLAGLGINDEGGEVSGEIKKVLFHGREIDRDKFIDECGDVLFYIAIGLEAVDADIVDALRANVKKRRSRYPNGFVKGGGIR